MTRTHSPLTSSSVPGAITRTPRRAVAAAGSAMLIALAAACTAPEAPRAADAAKGASPPAAALEAARSTAPVAHDADDPAVWINRADPSKSLILGTDKVAAVGALYVFDLAGHPIQKVAPLDRPNNVDVEYGVTVGGRPTDIAVVTERKQGRLRVFAIRSDGSGLDDLGASGIPVLSGQPGDAGEPMGIALYRRARDGATFAIVSPKTGGSSDYLWQYRLDDDGRGGLAGRLVRRFGTFSGIGPVAEDDGEIEAVAVDDELGWVYYADERFGIRKWWADPEAHGASRELAVIGTDGYAGDREGLAVVAPPGRPGYLVSSDQVPGATRLHVYARTGPAHQPHAHPRLAIVPTVADATDGIEATPAALPDFKRGMLIMMNSTPRNFLMFDWLAVEARIPSPPWAAASR